MNEEFMLKGLFVIIMLSLMIIYFTTGRGFIKSSADLIHLMLGISWVGSISIVMLFFVDKKIRR